MLNNFCFYVHAQTLLFIGDRFLPTLYVPLYHVYSISFGNRKPDNVDRDYIVLLSNLIEEVNVQCIVE